MEKEIKHLAEKTIEKMRISHIGVPKSEEHKKNLNLSLKGKNKLDSSVAREMQKKGVEKRKLNNNYNHSKETKDKIGISNLGKVRSERVKFEKSEAMKKLWKNPDFRKKNKGNLGKCHSEETKRKISSSHIGLRPSEKTRRKMVLNHKGNLGQHHSEETKRKIGIAHEGSKTKNWKGDNVSLRALHHWVAKNKEKTYFCEFCKKENSPDRFFDLANIKNHNYTRNPDDYRWLCPICHKKLDNGLVMELKVR